MNYGNLNFRGNYRAYDENGKLITYVMGDVVNYNGETYVAKHTISETSPAHPGWTLLGGVGVKYYADNVPPLNVNAGDEWLDIGTGKMYKYIDDGNSIQWVNIY
jgi:hypothetical protein